jgi:hypothetical protein
MQSSLLKRIPNKENLIDSVSVLLQASAYLNIPVIASEHDSEKYGETDVEIVNLFHGDTYLFSKYTFSMITDKVMAKLKELKRTNVVIFGVETHCCILNTCLDLVTAGFNVYVVWNAVASFNEDNHKVGLERLKFLKTVPTTVESVIYELLGNTKDEKFEKLNKILNKIKS